jgi:biopolymer transport protein ExbD
MIHRSSNVISPNLTPLLDVVLQLITFFMMLVHFGTRLEGSSRAVRLPVAPAALPGSDLTIDRLAVSLDRRGGLLAGDRVLTGQETSAYWAGQAKARRAGLELLPNDSDHGGPGALDLPTVVILRADRDVSYANLRRTLNEAQNQGFVRFSLVVLRREQP